MKILTGPKGGKYYIDEKGNKHYLKKGTVPKSGKVLKDNEAFVKHTITVADYEHSGDIDHEIAYIKSICPQARNFKGWEEEDYEAESDYEHEYGECEEGVYQGYVSFEAPASWDIEASKYGVY